MDKLITDITIRTIGNAQRTRAIVTITLSIGLVIRNIKILGKEGMFKVVFPAAKSREKTFTTLVEFQDVRMQVLVENAILKKYQRMIER